MKPFLFFCFLFVAAIGYSQDMIKINGSDPINCKILSVTKDEIIFTRNGTQRKANTAYVDYYRFNESVKEKHVSDSIPFVETPKDTFVPLQILSLPVDSFLQPGAGEFLIEAGQSWQSGLTLILLGTACATLSPLAISTKEIDHEINLNGSKTTYQTFETNYTGMYVLAGAGLALDIIGIIQLFDAANNIENAGRSIKSQGLSLNGSLQGIHLAYRF